jgi:subtilisin family serine protease
VAEEQAASAQAELAQQAGVLAVMEAQPVHTADWIPNDPQWGLQYGPQRVQAPQAWSTTVGSASVVIAIIDTGLDLTHPDLAGKIWSNPGEIAGNGIDDDHNGYKDDVRGWDWYNGDNNPSDDHSPGHGSHVAGIAAAASNNSVGIAGMAWNAKLMPLKVLGGDGSGADWAVAEAITYATKRGAKVINLSLAGYGLGSYVRDAVNFAYSQGVVVVAAAGNNGSWGLMEPGSYANAWGVIATDEGNNRAGYSNFGNEADFAAPGNNIYSTVRGGYRHMSGTSMAAPHVAGAAALLRSLPAFNTPTRIQSALRLTTIDSGAAGWDPYYGYGRIQVARALTVGFDPMPACVKPGCYRVLLPFAVP